VRVGGRGVSASSSSLSSKSAAVAFDSASAGSPLRAVAQRLAGPGSSYTIPSGGTTLYAQWTENTVSYTVTFNANGGSGTMAPKTDNAPTAQLSELPLDVPERGASGSAGLGNRWECG